LDKLALNEGWLVVFERRKRTSWKNFLENQESHWKNYPQDVKILLKIVSRGVVRG